MLVFLAWGVLTAVSVASLEKDPSSTHTLQGSSPIHNDPVTQRLKDEDNREVYFHGVNVVVKGHPWIPETEHFDVQNSFSDFDMQTLQELGLNGIRLGAMWPGAEPERGQYNMTYIDALMNLTIKAAGYGIYSLLDMHQDVLSPKFCGEGAPGWAVMPSNDTKGFPWPLGSPYTLDKEGVPVGGYDGKQCKSKTWGEYYPSEATGNAFQRLYENYDGLRDSWASFWKTMATAAQRTGPAVLGFELINEPWAGDVIRHPKQIIPGVADKKLLQPFYEAAAEKIRTVDNTHVIFFEGVTWDWFSVGFTEVPGGPTWSNLSALSYHFYVPPDFSLDVQFTARKDDMKRLQCGGMLTEFSLGNCHGCGSAVPSSVMDQCDAYAQSWLGWEYKPYQGFRTGHTTIWNSNGTLNEEVANTLTRTYARVVAGNQQNARFNTSTYDFDLVFTTNPMVSNATTMIYLNQARHYAAGYTVALRSNTTAVTLTWSQVARNHLQVTHHFEGASFQPAVLAVSVRKL